jgi:uncharacterized protein (DUF1697 family)
MRGVRHIKIEHVRPNRGHVVFLRAANVGGKNVFRPAQLAASLSHLDVVNVGAAGTFVVRRPASIATIRREIVSRVPFDPDIAIRPAGEVLDFVRSEPFRGVTFSKQLRGWVAVLTGTPKAVPSLPVIAPTGNLWSVRFDRLDGAYALGLWHWRPKFKFASVVVEDAVGVSATTRWWETFERIAKILER